MYAEFDTDRSLWLRAIRVFAELDCLISLAKSSLAIDEPSCRPEFVERDMALVDFEELRHPTLSMSANVRDFIPNDIKLGGDYGRIALLTGALTLLYVFRPSLNICIRPKHGVRTSLSFMCLCSSIPMHD